MVGHVQTIVGVFIFDSPIDRSARCEAIEVLLGSDEIDKIRKWLRSQNHQEAKTSKSQTEKIQNLLSHCLRMPKFMD
jgi:hypothetical protein